VLERQFPLPFVQSITGNIMPRLSISARELGSMLFPNPFYLKRGSVPCRSAALSAASAPRTA
jgi:hypothetical protein